MLRHRIALAGGFTLLLLAPLLPLPSGGALVESAPESPTTHSVPTEHAGQSGASLPRTELAPGPDVSPLPVEAPVPTSPAVNVPTPEVTPATPPASVSPVGAAPVASVPEVSLEIPQEVSSPEATTLEGTLVRAVLESDTFGHSDHAGHEVDDHKPGASTELSFVDVDGELIQVAAAAVEDVPSGSEVSLAAASFVAAANAQGGYQEVSSVEVLTEAPAPVTQGDAPHYRHEVTLVGGTPPAPGTSPIALSTVADLVNGAVNDYWSSQTNGEHTFRVVKAVDGFRPTVGCENAGEMWRQAALHAGFTAGANKHLMVVFPTRTPHCQYGLASVGGVANSGGRSYISFASLAVIGHELGHNLGLYHSGTDACPPGVVDGAGCSFREYHDAYDIMGATGAQTGNLSGAQLDEIRGRRDTRLDVRSSVRTDLYALGHSSGARVLKVTSPRGGRYFIEYRSSVGRDGLLASDPRNPGYGIQVRRQNSTKGPSLLDVHWGGDNDYHQVMTAGQVMSLEGGAVVIWVNSLNGMVADISVVVDNVHPEAPSASLVNIISPVPSTTHDRRKGDMYVKGTATAPEGTILWKVTETTTGQVVGTGHATTGVNGHVAAFDFYLDVPKGSYELTVWVPNEGEGEESSVPPGNKKTVFFTALF